MRVRPLILIPLLATAFAGCADAPDGGDPGAPFVARDAVEFNAPLPDWHVGQGWRYVMDVPGHRTQTVTMIVAEEHDDLWVVAAADREQALHNALFSLNPVLGRITKETLSPFQDGQPVEMYRFPLTDGARWNTTFFGEPMEFVATFVGDIPLQRSLGLGEFAEGFRIVATGTSGTSVRFDFAGLASWFTHFEVLDPDGRRLIRFDLIDLVDDHRGPYHFYRGEDLLIETYTSMPSEPAIVETEVPRPERFADGMAAAFSYLGRPDSLPPTVNVTLRGPPGEPPLDTAYIEHDFSSPGHDQVRSALEVDPACLAAADECSGPFQLRIHSLGATRLEARVVAYQIFAEGTR